MCQTAVRSYTYTLQCNKHAFTGCIMLHSEHLYIALATDARASRRDVDARARLLVVAGGRSPAWPEEDRQLFEAQADPGRAALRVLPNAGHWVHADDPDGLLAVMDTFERGDCWS